MKKLSVALAVNNEEKNLVACLESVKSWSDEIVIVDGGSTDKTVELAKQYSAKVIAADNPPIFHINKQKALEACRSEWILQLDADEVVSAGLREEILETVRKNPEENGFYVPRKNYFLGHWFRKGGQYPDYVIRVLRRGKGSFPQKSVHEQITIDGKVGYFKNPLLHYSVRSLSEYWKKADAYTSLTADEFLRAGVPKTIVSYIRYGTIKPLETFFNLFVRHKGFMDGIYGLLFSIFSAMHYPIAYQKYLKKK